METQQHLRSVRVNVAGGLGNQMFMFAAGRALAARTESQLLVNASGFTRDYTYKRVFLLDRLPISARILRDSWQTRALGLVDRLVSRYPWLAPHLVILEEEYLEEYPVFNATLLAPPGNESMVLRGFWQDERYFRDFADVVRRELTPAPPSDPVAKHELARIKQARHAVGLGIRFFREVPGGGVDPQQVISTFRRVVCDHATREPGCSYFVFTEEPRYFSDPECLGAKFTLITHRPRNEDALINLYLMATCRSFFIGYSSYHWWGAWLSTASGKNVTYLRFPGRPGPEYSARSWTTLDA
jgi:hypothetical protein